jgi:hypothetical protein
VVGIDYSQMDTKYEVLTGSGIQGTFPSNRTLLSTLSFLHSSIL